MNNIGKLKRVLVVCGLPLLGLNLAQANPTDITPLDSDTNILSGLGTLGSSGVSINPYPDTIGLTALRAITTNLNGAGVWVAQPEASDGSGLLSSYFEANPSVVGQPASLFTYYDNGLSATNFPNLIGGESIHLHADNVGVDFYGVPFGVATNVAHVDNYDASTFVYDYVYVNAPISARVINQSYTFGGYYNFADQWFDNYAAQYGVLFISGAGYNNAPVYSPASCYNGIAVGVYNNSGSPYGPLPDGRSKPDITAWGNQDTVTSYSTPLVSGSAAILMQAGNRGDGGTDTNSATDIRTLKALLLNGAIKPVGWTNTPAQPLHRIYGAGIVNVLNSYEQLAGGKHAFGRSGTVPIGVAPTIVGDAPLSGQTDAGGLLRGWDFNTITSSDSADAVNHYYFEVTNGTSRATFTTTATLVWNLQLNQSAINNLKLSLYNADNGQLVNCSTSLVDNVQHVYVPALPAGRYDLQVGKAGGSGMVSPDESYALAFEFFAVTAQATGSDTNMVVSWPVYPGGFQLVAATNYVAGNWSVSTNLIPVIVDGRYQVTLPAFDPNAIHYITVTNVGSGGPGFGDSGATGITNVMTVPVYNNNMDLHYLRLRRPNL